MDFSSGIHWPAGPNCPLTIGELAHLLSDDAARVSRPCFSNSDLGTLDLVTFYCQTFPWGLEHRMGRWTLTVTDPTTFLLYWACSSFLLGLRWPALRLLRSSSSLSTGTPNQRTSKLKLMWMGIGELGWGWRDERENHCALFSLM